MATACPKVMGALVAPCSLRLCSQTQCYVPAMAAEASLRDRRSRLLAEPGLMGEEFCRRYAAEADAWLSGLADRAAGDNKRHLALVAVGGYGRSSLCPYSDLDVVLVHNGHRDIRAVADGIWYPVWDEGVHLDHSVRRPSEVLTRPPRTSGSPSACSMRAWSGASPSSPSPLIEKAKAAWRDQARHQVPAHARSTDGRAPRHGRRRRLPARARPEGEPRWAARRQRAARHLRLRATAGRLRRPGVARRAPTSLLTSIRVELHRMAEREHDKLLLQDQDQVAAALGFTTRTR